MRFKAAPFNEGVKSMQTLSTKIPVKFPKLAIDGRPYTNRVSIVTVAHADSGVKVQPENAGWKSAVGGVVSGGVVAKYSWSGFQASHVLTHDQMVAGLIANGVTPAHAPGIADTALKIIQAEPTRILLVAVSAGGGTWALLEAGGKLFGWRLSARRKIALILAGAGFSVLLYLALRWAGVVR